MFKKRKKEFPAGTFIPTPKRILAIIQLCLAFSLILWYVSQPFMGEYFSLKSRMLLYEYAMGTSEINSSANGERFSLLSPAQQQSILTDYKALQKQASRPFLTKLTDGFSILLIKVPPFELAWMFFSVVIAILLLLKVEGAQPVTWLIPLIALAFGLDNQFSGTAKSIDPDATLFPSEQTIVEQYLKEPLSSSWSKQQEQLAHGWNQYLIDQWSPEKQLEEGKFNFTLARLQKLNGQQQKEWLFPFNEKRHPFILLSYLLWSVFFAWTMTRPSNRRCDRCN